MFDVDVQNGISVLGEFKREIFAELHFFTELGKSAPSIIYDDWAAFLRKTLMWQFLMVAFSLSTRPFAWEWWTLLMSCSIPVRQEKIHFYLICELSALAINLFWEASCLHISLYKFWAIVVAFLFTIGFGTDFLVKY